MNPLTDEDTISTVLRKGRPAEAYAIRQLSNMLFGDEFEPGVTRFIRPEFRVRRPEESERLHMAKWVCSYWLRHIPAGGDLSAALVELTSAAESIDNHLDFHATKIADEKHRVDSIREIFHAQAEQEKAWAQELAQEQAQEQADDQAQAAL